LVEGRQSSFYGPLIFSKMVSKIHHYYAEHDTGKHVVLAFTFANCVKFVHLLKSCNVAGNCGPHNGHEHFMLTILHNTAVVQLCKQCWNA